MKLNERKLSRGEHSIKLDEVEELFNSLGIDDYDINKNLQDGYVMILFNDKNYNFCLALRVHNNSETISNRYHHDDSWTTYNLWFDEDPSKPEWRGCSIQELRKDLEDLIFYLDHEDN